MNGTEEKNIENVRPLNDKEQEMLAQQDKKLVSSFKSCKLETDARRNWDLFYKRNTTNFFKDRQWMTREFNEVKTISENSKEDVVFLEAGCGVGNTFFPLKEEIPNMFVHACDFSARAVQLIKEKEKYNEGWCNAFVCDLSTSTLSENVPANTVDVVSLIFVLSAIHPDKFTTVFENIYKVLKPGGLLIFRDYGLNDWAMLRFKPGSKISDHFYVRQDGTRAYYFTKDEINELVEKVGFSVSSNEYVIRETVNKKEGVAVPRVFLQGKFIKEEKS